MTRHVDGRAQIERADRMARAVELRGQGNTIREIAAAMRCSASSAHALVTEALAQIPAENVQQLRAIEGDQLNGITRALWPAVQAGDAQAAAVAIRASARRAALYGLDSPVKVEFENTTIRMHHAMVPEALRIGPVGDDGYVEMSTNGGPVRQLTGEPETRPEILGPYD